MARFFEGELCFREEVESELEAEEGARRSYRCNAEESVARRRVCGERGWRRQGASIWPVALRS